MKSTIGRIHVLVVLFKQSLHRQNAWSAGGKPDGTWRISMSLAHVEERDGVLVVAQTNEQALRELRSSFVFLLTIGALLFSYHSLWPSLAGGSPSHTGHSTEPGYTLPASTLIFVSLPFLYLPLWAINKLFGKETFVFDKNDGVFIRNGFTVGPLREIHRVAVQVTRGMAQYPKFRLVLELPRCQVVSIVTDVQDGNFSLSRNGFGDPNKRFAIFEPWLDYEEQSLVPFVPSELAELRRKITEFIGYEAK